jgi:hypothetical protein
VLKLYGHVKQLSNIIQKYFHNFSWTGSSIIVYSRDTPIFYKEDPNKIEITAIGSLAGVEQRAGRGTAAFRWGGSPAVDRRWGRSFRGSMRFTRATWRGLGRPEGWVPTATRPTRRRGGCGAQGR